MTSADSPLRSAATSDDPTEDELDDELPGDEAEAEEEEEAAAADELSEETGIDLTDASELDADNVPADEEFDRVMQAPD
jgi:8-oxo-dGTP pyrophosphatase MutT (NUDIX family)